MAGTGNVAQGVHRVLEALGTKPLRAPDLALTQLLIETVTVILFLSVFRYLPVLTRYSRSRRVAGAARSRRRMGPEYSRVGAHANGDGKDRRHSCQH